MMVSGLQDNLILRLKEYVLVKIGLNFTQGSDKELIRKIEYAAQDFGYTNPAEFVEWLLTTDLTCEQTGMLASHLTIGETYFMREMKSFDFLQQIYLPALVHKRFAGEKRLSVWCAGCATGEEAYSLAITLLQSVPDIKTWDISILATDINATFLEKAKKGVYSKWSFRNNSETFMGKYFHAGKNEYHIIPAIKKMVNIAYLNLAEDSYPSITQQTSDLDIIFCRNVLIYFSQEGASRITNRFYDSLKPGGILVVSPVEVSGMISQKFNKINYAGFTIFQKGIPGVVENQPEHNDPAHFLPVQAVSKPAIEYEQIVARDDHSELDRLKKLLPEVPIVEFPLHPGCEYEQAKQFFGQGMFPEAEDILTRLLKNQQTAGLPAISLLAKTKANLGKLQEARDFCEQAMRLDKLDPALYYLLATVLQEMGDESAAISLLNKAIYLDHDFILAHFLLGTLSIKAGDRESGKKSFKNAEKSLSKLSPDETLPQSDGITVERFRELISTLT